MKKRLIGGVRFLRAINLAAHPFSTAQPCQFLSLRYRYAQGKRYRFLSLLYRLSALTPSGAASFVFRHRSK